MEELHLVEFGVQDDIVGDIAIPLAGASRRPRQSELRGSRPCAQLIVIVVVANTPSCAITAFVASANS